MASSDENQTAHFQTVMGAIAQAVELDKAALKRTNVKLRHDLKTAQAERDAAQAERDAAQAERDAAQEERNVAQKERDAAQVERDSALQQARRIVRAD